LGFVCLTMPLGIGLTVKACLWCTTVSCWVAEKTTAQNSWHSCALHSVGCLVIRAFTVMFRLFGIAAALLLTPVVSVVRQQTTPPPPPRLNLTEGEVTLEGGTAPGTGNVILYHNRRLWSVCDDGWNLQAAKVVCRSLGYPHALGHTSQSYFGRPRHSE